MVAIPTTVFGILALIITTLSGVVLKLYFTNQSLYKQINEIQEQRITDAKDTKDQLAQPLREIAQYTELTYNKIISGK